MNSSVANRRDRGFSLIELMVVLVLMGIMTAMIIPEMRGTFEEELLRSTGRKLASALNLAYSQSITVHRNHQVRLDKKAGRYVVERTAGEREEGPSLVPVKGVPGGEGELDLRITIEIRKRDDESASPQSEAGPLRSRDPWSAPGAAETIAFFPDGTAEAAEILLRDREGFGLALRINPTTARVQIVELERK